MEKQHLIDFVLHQADTNLILGQRLSEWCGVGPVLEQDIALANIALDLLGQASNYYQYAAELGVNNESEDTLAMLRTEREYKNLLLVEQPNGHFGDTVARQFFFDAYHCLLLEQLLTVDDSRLRGIAEKSLLEARYHLRWSSEWMIRLGDGTEESHLRMKDALDRILPYVGELFLPASYQTALIEQGSIPNPADFRGQWLDNVRKV